MGTLNRVLNAWRSLGTQSALTTKLNFRKASARLLRYCHDHAFITFTRNPDHANTRAPGRSRCVFSGWPVAI